MINTQVINGDHLGIKKTWKALFRGYGIYYQSKRKWLLYTLSVVLPICLISGIVLFIALGFTNFSSQHPMSEIILISFTCPAIVIPPTLIGTYIQSFVTIRRMTQTLSNFVYKRFSKETSRLIVQTSPLNYFVKTKDEWDIEIALMKLGREKNSTPQPQIIAAIYIIPPSQIESIANEWYEYCSMKHSCRDLHIGKSITYALFPIKEIDQEDVLTTIDQMKYLIQRFHLTPEKMIHDDIDQEEAKKKMAAKQH